MAKREMCEGSPSPYGKGTKTRTIRVPTQDYSKIKQTLVAIRRQDTAFDKWLQIGEMLGAHPESGAKMAMLLEVAKRLTA